MSMVARNRANQDADNVLVTIVTYNCDETLQANVTAAGAANVPVLVVDNGSRPSGVARIQHCCEEGACCAIYNETNMGIAYALNQGVRYAVEQGCQWVLTLDQDSLVTPGMVETMFNVYESLRPEVRERTAGLFATPIEKAVARPEDFRSDPTNTNYEKVVVGITSGNLLRTEVFEKVGFFDEKLFIDYVDHDFYLRLASAGYQLLECQGAKLIHQRGNYTERRLLGKCTATTNHSALRRYYITRNRMHMWKVYGASHPDFVRHDKKTFRKQLLKMLLVEDDRWAKLKMMAKGAMDYKRDRFGKLSLK